MTYNKWVGSQQHLTNAQNKAVALFYEQQLLRACRLLSARGSLSAAWISFSQLQLQLCDLLFKKASARRKAPLCDVFLYFSAGLPTTMPFDLLRTEDTVTITVIATLPIQQTTCWPTRQPVFGGDMLYRRAASSTSFENLFKRSDTEACSHADPCKTRLYAEGRLRVVVYRCRRQLRPDKDADLQIRPLSYRLRPKGYVGASHVKQRFTSTNAECVYWKRDEREESCFVMAEQLDESVEGKAESRKTEEMRRD
ncbi:hypothetical protein EXN66_Car017524 [Channa argus]|uniref:Uncharacterized protein n=1 Tax=Channa argus TaxID=215402 RepID=A0A6G1QIA9_CHAAH|nr:hypothetical protein EXN66_Car017524 [Channa argus]